MGVVGQERYDPNRLGQVIRASSVNIGCRSVKNDYLTQSMRSSAALRSAGPPRPYNPQLQKGNIVLGSYNNDWKATSIASGNASERTKNKFHNSVRDITPISASAQQRIQNHRDRVEVPVNTADLQRSSWSNDMNDEHRFSTSSCTSGNFKNWTAIEHRDKGGRSAKLAKFKNDLPIKVAAEGWKKGSKHDDPTKCDVEMLKKDREVNAATRARLAKTNWSYQHSDQTRDFATSNNVQFKGEFPDLEARQQEMRTRSERQQFLTSTHWKGHSRDSHASRESVNAATFQGAPPVPQQAQHHSSELQITNLVLGDPSYRSLSSSSLMARSHQPHDGGKVQRGWKKVPSAAGREVLREPVPSYARP